MDLQSSSLFSVRGKVCLVTGGGTGIGKMMAAALVRNGAKVYIASRKRQVVDETAKELNAMGPGFCVALQADLTSRKQAEELAAQIASREEKLHVLINNSGVSWGNPLEDFEEVNGWDRLMAVNVKAIFYLTTSLLPLLRRGADSNRDPARVINISSVTSVSAQAETPLSSPGSGIWSYAASKAAVNHLTRVLASTLARDFVTVNAIAPGVFPSRMTYFAVSKNKDIMESEQPMGRLGAPEDIGGVALFLSSRASAHITGAVIPLDGGQTLIASSAARL